MSLICPEDGSHLKPVLDKETLKVVNDCQICGGKFVAGDKEADFRSEIEDKYAIPLPRLSGKILNCSFCKSELFEEGGFYKCPMCHGCWLPNLGSTKSVIDDRSKVSLIAGEIMTLFIVGIILFSWQLGAYSSSADVLIQTSTTPLRLGAIVLWFVTFMLLFLVPATIYEQMILSHRPHFTKSLHNPLVRYLPIIVIVLMAINIYFLTP